jgi:hypothetical protein
VVKIIIRKKNANNRNYYAKNKFYIKTKNPRIDAGVLVFRRYLPEVRSPDAFPFTELSADLSASISPVVSRGSTLAPLQRFLLRIVFPVSFFFNPI